jgi:hypothetical protein
MRLCLKIFFSSVYVFLFVVAVRAAYDLGGLPAFALTSCSLGFVALTGFMVSEIVRKT